MPMVFPNQTRMYCRQSFFKVPLRTLWSDYMDFVGNFREVLEEPYHDFNGHIPNTGSLYDYLGLPTTLAGFYGTEIGSLGSTNVSNENPEIGYYQSSLTSDEINRLTGNDGNVTKEVLAECLRKYSQDMFSSNTLYTKTSPVKNCALYRDDNFSATGVVNSFLVRFGDVISLDTISKYLVSSAIS